jgi:hypothetical protein
MGAAEPLRVVVVGGGAAALEATLALRALAADRVCVELLAPEGDFTYRPLAVAEPFRVGQVRQFSLERLVEETGARLHEGTLPGALTFRGPEDSAQLASLLGTSAQATEEAGLRAARGCDLALPPR